MSAFPQVKPYGDTPRAVWPSGCTHLENGMIIGAAAAYERTLEDRDPGPSAEDVAMDSPDKFGDWLGAECFQAPRMPAMDIPRGIGPMEMTVERCTVPQLAMLVMHARADVRAFAGQVLRQRYLAAQGAA